VYGVRCDSSVDISWYAIHRIIYSLIYFAIFFGLIRHHQADVNLTVVSIHWPMFASENIDVNIL
jgi:hypothetical protein